MADSLKEIIITENLKADIKLLKTTLEKEKNCREREEAKCRKLEEIVANQEKAKKERNNQLSEKERTVFELQAKACKLTEELDLLKSKNKFQAQLFSKCDGEVMNEALEALGKAIRGQGTDHEYDVIKCMKASKIQSDIPLLVLIIASHNISQIIHDAIKGIHVSAKTAVVAVHLKAQHALPTQPTDRILSPQEFGTIGGLYDIGFVKEEGMYKCHFNDMNLISIINFIRRNGENRHLKKK